MNYKIIIAYDGAKYQGWQKNMNAKDTIEHKLEQHISEAVGEDIKIQGSGRTDKGVHAICQVANFKTIKRVKTALFIDQVNATLPEDITIRSIEKVDDDFHSRYKAVSKTYEYTIWKMTAKERPLFQRKYVYSISKEAALAIRNNAKQGKKVSTEIRELNVPMMIEASEEFIGTHDFKGFSSDKTKKSTERTIQSIEIIEDENSIKVRITGDGFLYNMVRIIVGTLIEIGLNVREKGSIKPIFEKKDRNLAGYTAPAQGLCLIDVKYDA